MPFPRRETRCSPAARSAARAASWVRNVSRRPLRRGRPSRHRAGRSDRSHGSLVRSLGHARSRSIWAGRTGARILDIRRPKKQRRSNSRRTIPRPLRRTGATCPATLMRKAGKLTVDIDDLYRHARPVRLAFGYRSNPMRWRVSESIVDQSRPKSPVATNHLNCIAGLLDDWRHQPLDRRRRCSGVNHLRTGDRSNRRRKLNHGNVFLAWQRAKRIPATAASTNMAPGAAAPAPGSGRGSARAVSRRILQQASRRRHPFWRGTAYHGGCLQLYAVYSAIRQPEAAGATAYRHTWHIGRG